MHGAMDSNHQLRIASTKIRMRQNPALEVSFEKGKLRLQQFGKIQPNLRRIAPRHIQPEIDQA